VTGEIQWIELMDMTDRINNFLILQLKFGFNYCCEGLVAACSDVRWLLRVTERSPAFRWETFIQVRAVARAWLRWGFQNRRVVSYL